MNKFRRQALDKIAIKISELMIELEALRDEEQECFDNMPENLQHSERGEMAEEAISNLDEALDSLEEAFDSIGEAIG